MHEWKFSRHINEEIIDKLINEPMWKKLKIDCINGEIFLAIRSYKISFYYKGRGFFHYNNNGFSTNPKYSKNYTSEMFNEHYDTIKKNCEQYLRSETEGVSYLNKNNSYLSSQPVVLLDIETGLKRITDENKMKTEKIDILLYNKELNILRFVEAKLLNNNELWNEPIPSVINQIKRYKLQLYKHEQELKNEYIYYFSLLSKIFNGILEIPKKINNISVDKDNITLVIFGYNSEQIHMEKLNNIINNPKYNGVPIFSTSNPEMLNAIDIWEKAK